MNLLLVSETWVIQLANFMKLKYNLYSWIESFHTASIADTAFV